MGLYKKKILGIAITTNTREEILEEVEKSLAESGKREEKPFIIVTPNPEQIILAQKEKHFAQVLNNADVAIPDGVGIVWAIQKNDASLAIKRIAGVEFMEDLVGLAAKEAHTIGLIGGWHGVALAALERLQKKYVGLSGWAIEPEEKTIEEIVQKIADTNTRLVFVGLGAPKQEYFIEKLQAPVVAMAAGGSFDIIAGRTPRAPFILRAIGIEWLWRLVMEPWRWRRQLALLKFIWLAAR